MRVVSDTPLRLVNLEGHTALLEAGVPKEVRDDLGILALGQGAKMVDDEPAKKPEPEIIVVEDKPDDRHERLVAVMQDILDEGNPDNFTAMKTPKAAVVNRKFGGTVLTEEREAAWKIVSED